MPKWRFLRWGSKPKDKKKDERPVRPPTEEELRASADLDAALDKAAEAETQKRERHEAILAEQAEFEDEHIGWELLERVYKNRADLTETQRMDAKLFRRKKGLQYFGAVKEAEPKLFDDRNISRDLVSVASQQIEEGQRDSKESMREQYRRGRNSERATVVEHTMADMGQYILGDDVEIVLTDQPDDRMGGCDAVGIKKDKNGNVIHVIGLDFTSAHEQEFIDKKIARSLRGVVRGYLNTLNYLRTKDNNGRDVFFSSRYVPRTTIGVSHMSALLFAKRWEQRGKAGAEEIIGKDRRASMLYAMLEQLRGQREMSQVIDEEKRLNQPSDATNELRRSEAWILSIIKEAGLEWPYHQHKDQTLERIRSTVKSRGKSGKMRALLEKAKQDVEAIAQKRALENGSN